MRSRPVLLLIFLLMISASRPAWGQEHSYVHYDVRDGLAGSTVYAMAQDKDGYIWFATETGLSRFDGTHFRNFTTNDGLPDNEILKIFVDSKNRIWFLPFKNTVAYYWKGKFHTAKNDTILSRLKITNNLASFVEDAAGNILLKEDFRLHLIDTNGRITNVNADTPTEKIAFMTAGLNAKLGFRVLAGMFYCDLVNGRLIPVRRVNSLSYNSPLVDCICPRLEMLLEFGKIVFYDPVTQIKFDLPAPKGYIGSAPLNDSSVMIYTYTNTYLVDLRQQKITDSFLQGRVVNSALEDCEGNVWFSTLGKGVYRMGTAGVGNYYFKVRNNSLGICSIRQIDSTIYFGGDHYFLASLDLPSGRIRSGEISGYSRGRIMDIARADRLTLLLGDDFGLHLFKGFQKNPVLLQPPISIKSFQLLGDTAVFFASNLSVGEIKLSNPDQKKIFWHGRSTAAYKDIDGICYFGTLDGLYTTRYGETPSFLGEKEALLASRITRIDKERDGLFWIATGGNGMIAYRDGRILAHITEAEGLTSNNCRTLFIDSATIWAGTDKGLNKITKTGDHYSVISYTTSDGLSSDMINTIYVKDKTAYVGTSEGVTFFNENSMSKRSECLLRITGLQVSDRQLPIDSTGFVLPHTDNNIKFDFVGISYKSAGKIVYRYRLLGLDTAWKTVHETFLSYPSLPSGNYELQLIAINKFGVRSLPVSVAFTVDKLLWERTWFRLLILLSVAATTMLYFNYRIRRVRKIETEKAGIVTKMAELEQMALRSQMNPHFIFNCLNSIQQYVLFNDALGSNEFITKFAYLIRQTLDISSRPFISLQEEINYIETYMSLEKKRFDNKFIYEIVVAGEVDRSQCHIPPMILQPYIENAVRHGIGFRKDNEGRLLIKMQYREGCLVCIVEDNGVGRETAGMFKSANSINYQSVGMSLVAKRIEMLNKTHRSPVTILIEDLKDGNGSALGTRINIFFPLDIVLNE